MLGPFAASVGFKIGSDVISLIDFFTDDPDEGDDDENDVWKKQVQFAMPVIASLHPSTVSIFTQRDVSNG